MARLLMFAVLVAVATAAVGCGGSTASNTGPLTPSSGVGGSSKSQTITPPQAPKSID